MKLATLTWLSGKKCCEDIGVRMYVNSLVGSGYAGDKIVLTHDMPAATEKYLTNHGFEILEIYHKTIHNIEHDRHLAFARYLTGRKYDKVLITDCRDVVFQKDPFTYQSKQPEYKLLLVDEGMQHRDSFANSKDQTRFQKDLFKEYRVPFDSWPVINAGVVCGDVEQVKYFEYLLWAMSLRIPCGDQSALNYLRQHLCLDLDILFVCPEESTFCVTGEGYNKRKYIPYLLDSYYIVHQWDRLPKTQRDDYIRLYS